MKVFRCMIGIIRLLIYNYYFVSICRLVESKCSLMRMRPHNNVLWLEIARIEIMSPHLTNRFLFASKKFTASVSVFWKIVKLINYIVSGFWHIFDRILKLIKWHVHFDALSCCFSTLFGDTFLGSIRRVTCQLIKHFVDYWEFHA